LAPENTLAAFRKGAEYGYRMFECDAKLSADDVVFLMHDATLQRTTNSHGIGGEQSWQHLSQLDAGSWHSRHFSGEPLPTLANLSQYCIRNRFFLNIEIKPTPGLELKTGQIVAQQAALLWQHEEVPPLLTSFQVDSLKGAQQAAPHLPRGLLLHSLPEGWLNTAKSLDCSAVVCQYALWTPETVAAVHNAGMRCLSYTVNDEWATQHLMELKTDGIITDRVDAFSPAT
jgi:glycerophosphoryl diester phosphodiesterase